MSNVIDEVDLEALDALMLRLKEADEFDLNLSAEDIRLILSALVTLTTLQNRLSSKDITLHKLRKLLGIVVASEKLNDLFNPSDDTNDSHSKKQKKKPKPRQKPKKTIKPQVKHHDLNTLSKGDRCPSCVIGTLSKYEPANLLRITGSSPFTAINHVLERLRCNACGEYFTASLPNEVLKDGDAHQKYGYTAQAMMAIGKYFMGSPFYRQSTLQDILHMPISASTVYDQCEKIADGLHLIHKTFVSLAANAQHFHLDDTTHRILDQKFVIKPQRKTRKPTKRTGVYASGLIATLKSGQDITLFQTNIGHAGEWIDEVLEKRNPGQAPPILMSDALSSNLPSLVETNHSLCNSHGRRQFVDVINQFPTEVEHVLNLYKTIWENDDIAAEKQLMPSERLAFHATHSLPLMREILEWGQLKLSSGQVEENCGLGKAIRYFISHYDGLTCFCTIKGAKIDNNWMEAQLKLVVRGRKNSSFYKTLNGANVSDVITSAIATCINVGINPLDYLVAIQQNQDSVNSAPENWMPWNYPVNC